MDRQKEGITGEIKNGVSTVGQSVSVATLPIQLPANVPVKGGDGLSTLAPVLTWETWMKL